MLIIRNFVLATILILLVEFFSSIWYPVWILIQSQIIRVGTFTLIFCYLFFPNYIVKKYTSHKINSIDFMSLTLAYFFSSIPILLLVIWFAQKFIKPVKVRYVVELLAFTAMATTFIFSAFHYGTWKPGIHIYPEKNTWYDVQKWAHDHTAKDARFITPPYKPWIYNLGWNVVSERSTVVTLSELLEGAFDPEYILYWKPRFNDLAPGALDTFKGDVFENITITKKAFYSLDSKSMKNLAKKYNASYLVVDNSHIYAFSKVYENADYIVYKLP